METSLKIISETINSENLEIEYDIIPYNSDKKHSDIKNGLDIIDSQLLDIEDKLLEYNSEIDKLTNHADGIDYTIAVASGVITGLIDSFFVGEFSFENAHEFGKEKIENFVVKVAKMQGFKGNDNDVPRAIKFLSENKNHRDGKKGFHLASDTVTSIFGGGLQHHLRDFAHHPTPVGLAFSLLTQITKKAYGTDTFGNFIIVDIQNETFIGDDIPKKILYGFIFWIFHMVSDMAGSGTLSEGTGLPGPLLSLIKELSVLPIFKNKEIANIELPKLISKLFNGTLLNVRFDLRTEIGILHELSKQAMPVIINECIVRGAYFLRRLAVELRKDDISSLRDLKKINWNAVLPIKNRTITRMLTISCGTFTAIDIGDAAIRAVISSGGINPETARKFILRVNFVGIGRFAIAVGSDISQGIRKNKLEYERINLQNQQLHLLNAKLSYKQAEMWISAENTEIAIKELYKTAESSFRYAFESFTEIENNMQKIDNYIEIIEDNNSDIKNDMLDALLWG